MILDEHLPFRLRAAQTTPHPLAPVIDDGLAGGTSEYLMRS
jgi:hypothetical protein